MTEPLAFWQGAFVPQSQARLPLHDAGFVLGATVTDLCRTFRHRLFRLRDHLARFRRSCALSYIPLVASDDDLGVIADELVAHNATLLGPGQDLALVMFATPGPVAHYAGQDGGPSPPTQLGSSDWIPIWRSSRGRRTRPAASSRASRPT